MRKKKRTVWMNLLLVFALVAGLVFPASNVNAAGKQKKETKKVLVVYFWQQEQQRALQRKRKRQREVNCIRLKRPSHIRRLI